MLSLDSERWKELKHAHGSASDIPSLLEELSEYPPAVDFDTEPYATLWDSLCHQGDVYTASYAAVPHVIKLLLENSSKANHEFLLLVVHIEIAQLKGSGPEIPDDLKDSYNASLKELKNYSKLDGFSKEDDKLARPFVAHIAASLGQFKLAEAILALEPDVQEEFEEWMLER